MGYLILKGKTRKINKLWGVLTSILLFVSLAMSFSGLAQEKNYCDDPEAKAEWQALLKKYPGDQEVNVLHALRIGLCEKIDRGQVSVDDATKIFESARQAIVDRIERREKAQEEKGKL